MSITPPRALLLAGLALASCREPHKEPPAPAASSAAASGSHMGMQMELRTSGSAGAASSSSAAAPAAPAAPAASAEECRDLVAAGDAKLPPIPPGFTVRGVDASTPGAWSSLKRQGVAFTLHQVMLGGVINKDFQANWRMARACGLPRGAYHFLTPRLDGAAQARTFLQQLGDDRGELLPIVDVELPPGCKGPCCAVSCDDWSAATRGWLAEVERALGRKVWVYTVADFWKECLCNTSRFADRSLWLAGYPAFDLAPRPGFGGWQRWGFYQYKGNARLGQSVLDLNVFREGRPALDALIADNARKDP